jgi:hypothetical protein
MVLNFNPRTPNFQMVLNLQMVFNLLNLETVLKKPFENYKTRRFK